MTKARKQKQQYSKKKPKYKRQIKALQTKLRRQQQQQLSSSKVYCICATTTVYKATKRPTKMTDNSDTDADKVILNMVFIM